MGCCKDKLKKVVEAAQKAATIAKGNLNYVTDSVMVMLFCLPSARYEKAQARKAICQACEKHTWLLPADYVLWLKSHGIEVVKNLADLSALPQLPKQDYEKGKRLFCSVCKCWIPAKAEVERERCPEGKWER